MLYELQNIHDALTKTKDEHKFTFRETRPLEKFPFIEPIPNTTK